MNRDIDKDKGSVDEEDAAETEGHGGGIWSGVDEADTDGHNLNFRNKKVDESPDDTEGSEKKGGPKVPVTQTRSDPR